MSNEESSRKESITARDSSKSLSLKELIHAVRDELIASEEERVNDDKPALFEFETLDIEVHFVVTKGRLAKRGFSLKVLPFLPFGADAQVTGDFQKQQVHKITLSLRATEGELVEDSATERKSGTDSGPWGDPPKLSREDQELIRFLSGVPPLWVRGAGAGRSDTPIR